MSSIEPLANWMKVESNESKRMIAALAYYHLKTFNSLSREEARDIRDKMRDGLCGKSEFKVYVLAAESGKLEKLLCKREKHLDADTVGTEYIVPWVNENIVEERYKK